MARFTRQNPAPIVRGDYGNFRPYVRTDFQRICAYCLIPESFHPRGSVDFEIDHFKPKDQFTSERRNFYNLYYCCHGCNRQKWNKWPSEEEQKEGKYFVDLCMSDFDTHYQLQPDGEWKPLTKAAEYTVDMIKLNSTELKEFRCRMAAQGIFFR